MRIITNDEPIIKLVKKQLASDIARVQAKPFYAISKKNKERKIARLSEMMLDIEALGPAHIESLEPIHTEAFGPVC